MKELIDKLSLGMIEYDSPKAAADIEEISLTLKPGEKQEGFFHVANRGGGKLKGIIYSSDRHVQVKTKVFSGERTMIRYSADACCITEGSRVQGTLALVSNGGEIYIPFSIQADVAGVNTSIGEIRDMFHFADLVQKDYDEALRLFCSRRFEEIILKEDYALRAKYQALIQGADRNIAMDEFLIAASKKKAVNITASEEERVFLNLGEDYEDRIIVKKDNWGYIQANVEADGDFITLGKYKITAQDFNGNICEIPYVIHGESLRGGYHFGSVTVKSLYREIKIPIRVYRHHRNGEKLKNSSYLNYKKEFVRLYQCYLDFRMKRIPMDQWAENSLQITAKMRRFSDDSLFVQLVQAQIMTAQGKEVEARLILEEAERRLEGNYQKDIELYCFYLYVRAVRECSADDTKRAVDMIQSYYHQGYENWRLLWLLMYLDENYDRNESLKMLRIKEQYDRGMRSPLMYYETLMVLNDTPSLLRVLDDYEKTVILFGIESGSLSKKLGERILDISGAERSFDDGLFQILTGLYKLFGEKRILEEITGMLIKGTKTGPEYFCWYEKAVDTDLKITGLYEYYMHSISFDYEGRIPDVILMYFVYNLTLKGERLDFLYKKVIEYRGEAENIYRLYRRIMEKYVQECILQGRMNDKLAVVYKDVLRNAVPAPEYLEKLPDILNTYLIVCENPQVREIVVIHKEMKWEEHVPLVSGRAYVRIYSEDAAVVFADISGNRYMQTVNYRIQKLLVKEDLLKLCYEVHSDHLGLLIYYNDRYFRYRKYQDKAAQVMEKLIKTCDIRDEYKCFLEKQLIEYYAGNSSDLDFRKYLETIDADQLGIETRLELIRLSIMRGLYERGFQLLCACGCGQIDAKLIFKCVDKMLEKNGQSEDENLLYFAFSAFRDGKYNENTLNYICRYYYGSTQDMYMVWKAVKNFQCESRELEEKIVVQMIFTGEYGNHIGSVFESYIGNGASDKVKRAYLIRKSYDFFVKESIIEEKVFVHIERELENKEDVHYLCELAWLKYQSEKEFIEEQKLILCRKILYEMCERNKKFEFYKKFRKYFKLPCAIENKTILEYRTAPESRVLVHYRMDDSEEDYQTDTMTNRCYGVFTQEFILFYGETMKYYITEETDEETKAAESRELVLSREHVWKDESPYGILNNMMVCREMHEEKTLCDLMTDYYISKKLNESIFMTT